MSKEIKEIKMFCLAGTVTGIEDNNVELETFADSRGERYTTRHTIELATQFEAPGVGDHVKYIGQFTEDGTLEAFSAEPIDAKTSMNLARIVGHTAQTFEFYPRIDGKRSFGNLLMRVGGFFARCVAFSYAAQNLKGVTRGSIVQAQGRIDYRTNDGYSDPMMRIVLDPEYTKVIELAQIEDPFAGTTGELAMAGATTGDNIPF